MHNQEDSEGVSKARPVRGRLISGLRWLAEPARSVSERARRRSHLLAWLLLFLILLSISALPLVIIVDPPNDSRRSIYIGLILGLAALFIAAYSLNRAGHYLMAAGLTVLCAVLGPWGSLALDPGILEGDFVPLTYVALTILLSSMLLPPSITIALAGLQFVALGLLPIFSPATAQINWPSLLAMIFFTSVLSVLANIIQGRDMGQIESQTRQLAHSNELIYALAHITTHMERALTSEQIIQAIGQELSRMDLTAVIAVHNFDQKSFAINYASIEPNILEQMENYRGFPLREWVFSIDLLDSTWAMDEPLRPEIVMDPEAEIQLLFDQPSEKGVSGMLHRIGLKPGTELLRLPLVFEEYLAGILWVWGKGIRATDLPIMSIFAKQIGLSLERARLFQELQSLALTDPLTGLQNRRSLFELGRIEFSRAQRMKRPFCCMMLDLDHFKQVNDNYGHIVGDQVLKEFATRCKSSVRDSDLLGRYGGEEFLIFLPETDSETALLVAERLRALVAEKPMKIADEELNFTVSIGVARKDENTLKLETLIARADQAMYIAKHKGRNQVAISK